MFIVGVIKKNKNYIIFVTFFCGIEMNKHGLLDLS